MSAYDLNNCRYTLEEFYTVTEDMRAELIDGFIYNMAPPKRIHQRIVLRISALIDRYITDNKGECEVNAAPFGVRLSENTLVEPDITVVCDKNKLTEDGCEGAPDWVIEVASSNSSNDYGKKFSLYKNSGVREYWIIDPNTEYTNVYKFEPDSNIIGFIRYPFADAITADIYKDNPEPLEICVADLISDFNNE